MFKNVLSVTLLIAFSTSINAQSVAFRLNNYSVKDGKNITDKLIQGAEIGYFKHLGKAFDLYIPIRLGPRGNVETVTNDIKTKTTYLGNLGVDANLQAKYDNGHNFIVPFVSAGIGTEMYDSGLELGAPVGAGLNFRIVPKVLITLATNYRLGLSSTTPKGWMHSLGVITNISKTDKKEEKPYVSKAKTNQERLDEARLEAEAQAAEKAKMEAEAKARLEAENTRRMQLEAENRAKMEAEEKAKAAAKADALAKATVQDKPVVVSEEIKKVLDYALQGVQFEIGSALLTSDSYSKLDDVATTMTANPELRIRIEGHTDRTGNEGINQKLSEARAKTCMSYLISKGISEERLKVIGFGSIHPVSDNDSEVGRRQNRRVEFVPF